MPPHPQPNPFPQPLQRFVDLFNAEAFWESHEVLEGAWRAGRSSFYHGLILYASAWVHHGRRNAHGVGAQLRKARVALDGYPPAYLGVDVREVLERCVEGERRVAGGVEPVRWKGWLPPTLVLNPRLLRGDEVELGEAEPDRPGPGGLGPGDPGPHDTEVDEGESA